MNLPPLHTKLSPASARTVPGMRGIQNLSHTACHTSSSLQLLYHCFPTLRAALLTLAPLSPREKKRRKSKKEELTEESNPDEPCNELVYQLSHFFLLLTHGRTEDHPLSPKRQVRRRMKQPLTPSQQAAVREFMKRSEYGVSSGEDWRRLVKAMKNVRESHEDVQSDTDSITVTDGTHNEIAPAIDPTAFYQKLTAYTTRNESSNISPIHPTQVADSATVFRSLLHALEYSTQREWARTTSRCEILEIEQWNNEAGSLGSFEHMDRLRQALETVQHAIKFEWRGMLLSRIVGIRELDLQKVSEEGKSDSESGATITTALRRTKNGGGIERLIPVPFPLPMVQQSLMSQPSAKNKEKTVMPNDREYHKSLISSLYSVTIEPNPIRGYDWRGLMNRGEVTEETIVQRIDNSSGKKQITSDKPEIEQQQHIRTCEQSEKKNRMHLDGLSVVHAQEKMKYATKASQSIEVQAGSQVDSHKIMSPKNSSINYNKALGKVEARESAETIEQQQQPPPPPPPETAPDNPFKTPKTTPDKHNLYALAVAAIASNCRHTPRLSKKISLQKGSESTLTKSKFLSGLSGMEVGGVANSVPPSPMGMTSPLLRHVSAHSQLTKSDSEEESSIDSKVSSINDSMTRSSAIDTPSDIDELSLGSYTESEGEASKKSEAPIRSDLEGKERNENNPFWIGGKVEEGNEIKLPPLNVKVTASNDSQFNPFAPNESKANPFFIGEVNVNKSPLSDIKAAELNKREPPLTVKGETNPAERNPTPLPTNNDDSSDPTHPISSLMMMQSGRSTPSNLTEAVQSNDSSSSDSSSDSSTSSSSSSSSSDYTTSSSSDSSSSSDTSSSTSSEENLSSNKSKATPLVSKDTLKNKPNDYEGNNTKYDKREWVTRKETRFCHPLPKNLIFHLKRFEYSTAMGSVETISAELDIPEELDLKPCCIEMPLKASCYRYVISGAIVHVDSSDEDVDRAYGESKEGHYVTFVNRLGTSTDKSRDLNNKRWYEMDDDRVHPIDRHTCKIVGPTSHHLSEKQLALKVLSGCDYLGTSLSRVGLPGEVNGKEKKKERRYATLVVYSRVCDCCSNMNEKACT